MGSAGLALQLKGQKWFINTVVFQNDKFSLGNLVIKLQNKLLTLGLGLGL